MEYTLKHGKTEQNILEQCYRTRQRVPDAIVNAPVLQLGLELFYDAFLNLTTCRQLAQHGTEGPISWIVINEYCNANDIHGEQREDMFHHIAKMDSVYMADMLVKAKAAAKTK